MCGIKTRNAYAYRKHLKKNCEACGGAKKLHAHHIDQDYTNNAKHNIQTLCAGCHLFWHGTARRNKIKVAGKMPVLFEHKKKKQWKRKKSKIKGGDLEILSLISENRRQENLRLKEIEASF